MHDRQLRRVNLVAGTGTSLGSRWVGRQGGTDPPRRLPGRLPAPMMMTIPTGAELAAELFANAVDAYPAQDNRATKAAFELLGAYADGLWVRRFLEPMTLHPTAVYYDKRERRGDAEQAEAGPGGHLG